MSASERTQEQSSSMRAIEAKLRAAGYRSAQILSLLASHGYLKEAKRAWVEEVEDRVKRLQAIEERYRRDHAELHGFFGDERPCPVDGCESPWQEIRAHAAACDAVAKLRGRVEFRQHLAEGSGRFIGIATGPRGTEDYGALVTLLHRTIGLKHREIALLRLWSQWKDRLPIPEGVLRSTEESVRKKHSEDPRQTPRRRNVRSARARLWKPH